MTDFTKQQQDKTELHKKAATGPSTKFKKQEERRNQEKIIAQIRRQMKENVSNL